MRIFRQLVKEFWMPFCAAIAWTLINFYTRKSPDWSLTKSINIFGASFFLASWLTGQYFRIRKQSQVESDLEKIQSGVKALLIELEAKTKDLIGQVTGGDSFCYLAVSRNTGVLMVVHQGKYPISEVTAQITDLEAFEKIKNTQSYTAIKSAQSVKKFINLVPEHALDTGEIWNFSGNESLRRFNIFFTVRNGNYAQMIRFRKANGHWLSATKVERPGLSIGPRKVIFEQIDEGFPKNENGEIDW